MTDTATFIAQHEALAGTTPDQVQDVARALEEFAEQRILEQENLLRSIMEEAADRLEHNGPVTEIAQQLRAAASAAFAELASRNVEIQNDEDTPEPRTRPASIGDPILLGLLRAMQLHDAIAAISIAGEEPSEARHKELHAALVDLRNTLNTHLKDKA